MVQKEVEDDFEPTRKMEEDHQQLDVHHPSSNWDVVNDKIIEFWIVKQSLGFEIFCYVVS